MNNQQETPAEATNFNLEEARKQITEVTNQIVDLFCSRQNLMRLIAEAKKGSGNANLPIFLPQREQTLLTQFKKMAKKRDVDPHMVEMLVSMLMSAAKFAQMKILQRTTILDTNRPSDDELMASLLALTERVTQRYDDYGITKAGREIECEREKNLLRRLTELHHGGVAINLGCANGARVNTTINGGFERIIGYDISKTMIESARIKHPNDEFYVHDLREGIPLPTDSVNLVIANSGAASEIYNDQLWDEIYRVLIPGGRAFLSFYNRNALVTKWWTPWSNAFNITINPHNDTLMVPLVDKDGSVEVYWVNARSETEESIRKQASGKGFEIRRIESSSPLWDDKPVEFFKHEDAVAAALEYEENHAKIPPYIGQYLRIILKK